MIEELPLLRGAIHNLLPCISRQCSLKCTPEFVSRSTGVDAPLSRVHATGDIRGMDVYRTILSSRYEAPVMVMADFPSRSLRFLHLITLIMRSVGEEQSTFFMQHT